MKSDAPAGPRHAATGRAWLKSPVAVFTLAAAIATVMHRQWFESLFGIDPDQRSGLLEWAVVSTGIGVSLALTASARNDLRRLRACGSQILDSSENRRFDLLPRTSFGPTPYTALLPNRGLGEPGLALLGARPQGVRTLRGFKMRVRPWTLTGCSSSLLVPLRGGVIY
jgi:hypothetical protein